MTLPTLNAFSVIQRPLKLSAGRTLLSLYRGPANFTSLLLYGDADRGPDYVGRKRCISEKEEAGPTIQRALAITRCLRFPCPTGAVTPFQHRPGGS